MAKRIYKIEKIQSLPVLNIPKGKVNVAGYARVSTNEEKQHSSLESQKSYYTDLIKKNLEWNFVGMYFDDGISGLRAKNRNGFNSLITDALV